VGANTDLGAEKAVMQETKNWDFSLTLFSIFSNMLPQVGD